LPLSNNPSLQNGGPPAKIPAALNVVENAVTSYELMNPPLENPETDT